MYVYGHTYVCMYIGRHVFIWLYVYICDYQWLYIIICVYMIICLYIYVYDYIHDYIYIWLYDYVYIYLIIYNWLYIYAYMYISWTCFKRIVCASVIFSMNLLLHKLVSRHCAESQGIPRCSKNRCSLVLPWLNCSCPVPKLKCRQSRRTWHCVGWKSGLSGKIKNHRDVSTKDLGVKMLKLFVFSLRWNWRLEIRFFLSLCRY